MTTEISAPEPAAQAPAPAKTSAKKATSKKRTPKKSAPKKHATKKHATKKAAKMPIGAKKSVAKKSAAKKSTAKKSAPKKRRAKKQPVVVNKSQSIRDAFEKLGRKARPRDIIAALAEKGITVVSAQVSMALKAAGLRRGRRRKKVVAATVAPKPSTNGHAFLLDELVKVKKLVDELGGTAKLKELAAALERLA